MWGVSLWPLGKPWAVPAAQLVLGTAACIRCERGRKGEMRRCGRVVSSGVGDKKKNKKELRWKKRESASLYTVSKMLPDRRRKFGYNDLTLRFFPVRI